MALTVEDGSIVAGADSYITLAAADAYHAARGITLWATMSEAEREQALRRATDYMTQAYRLRWAGRRVTSTQPLDWPRYEVPQPDASLQLYGWHAFYPSDEVPSEVQNACAELAYRGAAGPLMADITKTQKTIREKVDVIEVEYAPWTPTEASYRAVDSMLAPLLKSGGAGAMRTLIRC